MSHDCQGFNLTYSSDFNGCTDRARIYFEYVRLKRKKICSFENSLVEKSESSARNKNGLVERLSIFSV